MFNRNGMERTIAKNQKLRNIFGDLLLVLTLLFTLWLSAVMLCRIRTVILADTYKRVYHRELVICALFFVLGLDLRFDLFTRAHALPVKAFGWVLRGTVTAATAAVLTIGTLIIAGGMEKDVQKADHVLVLGMALENGQPTEDLRLRVKTAAEYTEAFPESILILTGGNTDEQGRSEALAMRDLLAEIGVAPERMILEDKARDTRANFENTAKLIDPSQPTAIVTNGYHMRRAVRIAESAGFSDLIRLPAPSDPIRWGPNLMWEIIMELNRLINK